VKHIARPLTLVAGRLYSTAATACAVVYHFREYYVLKRVAIILAALAFVLSACGQNRSTLAASTVQEYWTDIQHAKFSQAYNLLTPGNQAARPKTDYAQDMFNFLENTGGLTVTVGSARVSGDLAAVPLKLHSPKQQAAFAACQHLVWNNGKWLIADQNGGLTVQKDCRPA
jgi:hypothetical protein